MSGRVRKTLIVGTQRVRDCAIKTWLLLEDHFSSMAAARPSDAASGEFQPGSILDPIGSCRLISFAILRLSSFPTRKHRGVI